MARRGATIAQALEPQARDLAPLLMQDAAAPQSLACARAVRGPGGTVAEAGGFGDGMGSP